MATIPQARLIHILYGDQTGGGHMHGYGNPTKSHFPALWSAAAIEQAILAIANNPLSRRAWQPNGRLRLEGEQNTIKIRVVVNTADEVWTAHPIDSYSIP